jgi:transposase
MTFIAALRHDRIDAPWLIDGPIDGEGFRTYVEKVLAPTLRPGELVIMDNLGSHKGKAIRQAIRSAGAKLFFLPKYSPDLNPIEQVFAKLKHLLRNTAARTVEALVTATGALLGNYTAQERANYFVNAGYGQTWKHPALVGLKRCKENGPSQSVANKPMDSSRRLATASPPVDVPLNATSACHGRGRYGQFASAIVAIALLRFGSQGRF